MKEKVETWLAWQRVGTDLSEGVIGAEFERGERAAVASSVKDAEDEARSEVWAEYRFVILAETSAADGLGVLDLGPGHRSGNEALAARIVSALKAQNFLNESVGAGYIERKWPEAFKASGTWPLSGLRQAFLNGSLTRLLDVDAVLKAKIVEFIGKGDFGLASGQQRTGSFSRVWFKELISGDEVAFDGQTFLLLPSVAKLLIAAPSGETIRQPTPPAVIDLPPTATPPVGGGPEAPTVIRLTGSIPPEIWNRVGNKLIPKLRTGEALDVAVGLTVKVNPTQRAHFIEEVRQILSDLGLAERVTIEAQ